MLRHTIYSAILTAILLLLIVLPVAAHGGEEEAAATGFSDGMILAASLITAVVAGVGLRKLRSIQRVIAALVVITGIVHLMAGTDAPLLLANGLGYLAILAALYLLPVQLFKDLRVPLYWLLIAHQSHHILLRHSSVGHGRWLVRVAWLSHQSGGSRVGCVGARRLLGNNLSNLICWNKISQALSICKFLISPGAFLSRNVLSRARTYLDYAPQRVVI